MRSKQVSVHGRDLRRQLPGWYEQPLGRLLQEAERSALDRVLANLFGYHLLQVGAVGWETELLAASRIGHRVILDPDGVDGAAGGIVHGQATALPIATDSVDAIVLPHTLEFEPDPHQVLREAERVLVSEGHVVILGFNPWSLWGLWRVLPRRRRQMPWCGDFLSQVRIRDWLALLGFDIQAAHEIFFRPPLGGKALMKRLQLFDRLGQRYWPFLGAVYVLVAVKRVSTLTQIKPRWRTRARLVGSGVAAPSRRSGPSS